MSLFTYATKRALTARSPYSELTSAPELHALRHGTAKTRRCTRHWAHTLSGLPAASAATQKTSSPSFFTSSAPDPLRTRALLFSLSGRFTTSVYHHIAGTSATGLLSSTRRIDERPVRLSLRCTKPLLRVLKGPPLPQDSTANAVLNYTATKSSSESGLGRTQESCETTPLLRSQQGKVPPASAIKSSDSLNQHLSHQPSRPTVAASSSSAWACHLPIPRQDGLSQSLVKAPPYVFTDGRKSSARATRASLASMSPTSRLSRPATSSLSSFDKPTSVYRVDFSTTIDTAPSLPVRNSTYRHHITNDNGASYPASSSPIFILSPTPIRRRALAAAIASTMSQTRSHSGHSHGHHHHHHDNIYLTSKNKNDAGVRITRIGLFANLGMAIAKGVGGYAFHSHAMVADAYHSLTDLASDVLTLMTVSWSLKEPTREYPTGFGKVESLGSLGVSGMLFTGGLLMCWGSFIALLTQLGVDLHSFMWGILEHAGGHGHSHGHSHGHDHGHGVPSLHAAWLAGGTILIKEWLYHQTMAVARERKSTVLASNAIHHRIDSLTGVVTLAVVLASNLFTSASWLDPVGGLLISALVIKAGAENTVAAFAELADRALDPEVTESVRKYTLRVLDELEPGHGLELRGVSGVKSGQNYLIDLEVAIPTGWNVEQMRVLEDSIRFQIGSRVRGAKRVRVRFVPVEGFETKEFDEFVPGDVTPREGTPEPEEHDHDHDHKHGECSGHKEEKKAQ